MTEVDLLNKTELKIEGIDLKEADLRKIADAVADTMGVGRDEVWVIDAKDNEISLDIVRRELEDEQFVGKRNELMENLSSIPGVEVSGETEVNSRGILGAISLPEEEAEETLRKSRSIRSDMIRNVAKRAVVYATGDELRKGRIQDTNTPYIESKLEEEGFKVRSGDILPDDQNTIVSKLWKAINEGYGLVITTGGVGAEEEDKTIESLLSVDDEAETPSVLEFEEGKGRHAKEHVRIGVGKVGQTLIVALPGPNEEVRLVLSELVKSVKVGLDKQEIAERISRSLRRRFQKN